MSELMLPQDKIIFLLPLLGVITSLYIFCSQNKHLLVSLLSLEGVVLNLYFLTMMNSVISSSSLTFIFITLAVCEAALGLSILISIVRTHNNDFVSSLNML